jgi:hypothetical protein
MSVTPAHVRWLRSLSAATKVSFLGCAIFPGVIDELSTMPTLTEIDCSRSEFVGDGFPALAKISSLRAITVEQVGDDDFRAIARIRSLRVLTVQAARGRGAATAKRISWETIREVRAARPDLVIEYDVGS